MHTHAHHEGFQWFFHEKVRPTRLKTAFFGHFGLAGRIFSHSQPRKGEQGELFRAQHATTGRL